MNATQRKQFRIELLKQRDAIANRRSQEREALRLAGEHVDVADEGDLSALDLVTEIDAALLQLRGETLLNIDNALQRMDGGTYGQCDDCEEEIPAARLYAVPFAQRCRAREEMREIDHAHAHPHIGLKILEGQENVHH